MADNVGAGILPAIEGNGLGASIGGSGTLPAITGLGYGGGIGDGTLEAITGEGSGYDLSSSGAGSLEAITGSGTGVEGSIGIGEGKIPHFTGSGSGVSEPFGIGAGTLPNIRGSGRGVTGTIGTGSGELPAITGLGYSSNDTIGVGAGLLAAICGYGQGVTTSTTFNRKAVVMNVLNHAISHYVNFNFNSLAYLHGVYIGANEDGLYELGGDDDLGERIIADIVTGTYDHGEGEAKLPEEGSAVFRTDGELSFGVSADEQATVWKVFSRVGGRVQEWRAKLGKGTRGRLFKYCVSNRSGSPFDLHSLRILGRVIRGNTK